MKFTLEIELGNEAMQDGHDVAQALNKVARTVEWCQSENSENVTRLFGATSGAITDGNGNTVGRWAVKKGGG